MKLLKKILTILVLATIIIMWIKEVTERRARRAADRFLGPTLDVLKWRGEHLTLWMRHDSNGKAPGPRWIVGYERRVGFDWPVDVEVDLLGHIRGINNEKLKDWINMSDSERTKEQEKLIETEDNK